MPRNNPEQRKNRMQAALHRATECLDAAQVTSGSETFLAQAREDLRRLETQLERRDALDPRVTVVAVAGPSGTGKSTVVNTLARRNSLVPTGTHRPTTTELVAYVDADVAAEPFLELSGIPRSASVEFCSSGSNPFGDNLGATGAGHQIRSALSAQCGHPIVVEVPDTLLVPELAAATAQVLETADIILWTTDSQKYADAAFHNQISAFPRHRNSYFVLTHTEGLTETQVQTLHQELAAIAARLGVSPEILQISVYDDSSLARFRETVAGLSRAPEARWRGEQAAIHHVAERLSQDLALDESGESVKQPGQTPSGAPSPAETTLVDQVAQVSGLAAVQANFSKQYLEAGGFWTLWPVLNCLAGIKPLTPVNQNSSTTPGEPDADKPVGRSADSSPEQTADGSESTAVADSSTDLDRTSEETTPQIDSRNRFSAHVNAAGITSAARTYAVTASAQRPPKWLDFAQLKAVELSGNLVSALNLALESWKFPARPVRTWWRVWRLGHWFWLAALLVGLLWSLIAGVAFLGGAGTSAAVWLVGPVPFPLVVLAAAIVGTGVWSSVGAKVLHCGAQNYGKECADKFRSLIQEVTRQGFLVKMNQNLDLYPQLSELFSEMRSRDTQSR
ncbi:ABC transporter [uncultured Mobiluncus sp.]|uniref:ABC transporter n=1 Tax=uncultured Mobiluncus sp. TaxID=293425 RepID=UPI0025E5A2B9|nr:ABC transporter [uncultured Mobiluncus sp.]